MDDSNKTKYLANVLSVSAIDGSVSENESKVIRDIVKRLQASDELLQKAAVKVDDKSHTIAPVGRFSDQVRNLEDMALVCLADGGLDPKEKKEILSFAGTIGITQAQLIGIVKEARAELAGNNGKKECPGCGKTIDPRHKFCTYCGTKAP